MPPIFSTIVFASFLPMLSIVPVKTNDFPCRGIIDLNFFLLRFYTGFSEFIHYVDIFMFVEKFNDACGDFRADFIYRRQIFLLCGNQIFHTAEMVCQKFGSAFSHVSDAQSVNEFIQRRIFGFMDGFD